MCRAFSALVTENDIYMADGIDSHEALYDHFSLRRDDRRVVPVEFYPDSWGDIWDAAAYKLRIDLGDLIPEWLTDEVEERVTDRLRARIQSQLDDGRLMCEELNCNNCTSLQSLPELPVCERLYCCSCDFLRSLPELPVCEVLLCRDCSSLQSLPELPVCDRLICFDCGSLQSLPELPMCTWLECDVGPNWIELRREETP